MPKGKNEKLFRFLGDAHVESVIHRGMRERGIATVAEYLRDLVLTPPTSAIRPISKTVIAYEDWTCALCDEIIPKGTKFVWQAQGNNISYFHVHCDLQGEQVSYKLERKERRIKEEIRQARLVLKELDQSIDARELNLERQRIYQRLERDHPSDIVIRGLLTDLKGIEERRLIHVETKNEVSPKVEISPHFYNGTRPKSQKKLPCPELAREITLDECAEGIGQCSQSVRKACREMAQQEPHTFKKYYEDKKRTQEIVKKNRDQTSV